MMPVVRPCRLRHGHNVEAGLLLWYHSERHRTARLIIRALGPDVAREGALVTSAHYNPISGFRITAFCAAQGGPSRATRSAAWQHEEEAETRLPPSDFLHFVCRVLVVGQPPEVELQACRPFNVRSSAAWTGTAAELGAARWVLEEGSGLHSYTPAEGLGWTKGPAQKYGGERGPRQWAEDQLRGGCGGVARERPNGLRCSPEGEGFGSSCGELAYWCMVHGLVVGPSSEEALTCCVELFGYARIS
ncbi:hypothetical protein NDU88_005850 [Pleurodeles waltl]|uniref:Uncharacterized protein n=1 Tax=Pleurodeles waltl TaxID=8319 RepID=A0AAV7PGR5_PLEWA|nr:hypothetical protein NDU88_005850 [Pleurodeles waltl]